MKTLVDQIKWASKILLTTHRQCDGDGLGAQLALYHALKKIGKYVKVVNVDETPTKYNFLKPSQHIEIFSASTEYEKFDIALVFDTNDERLVEPLFSYLKEKSTRLIFIDHHPVLTQGPWPTTDSVIDTSAASTGELAYKLIKQLEIPLDQQIAKCLYTSITFDTQLFRYVRSSPTSHLIAAELLHHEINTEEIHRGLYGNQTISKMNFLVKTLSQIEFILDGKVAIIKINDSDLIAFGLDIDDTRDVIDFVMNIETVEAAALFREEKKDHYKLSLRSKGRADVLPIAEMVGGGGHLAAAGAYLKGDFESLKHKITQGLLKTLKPFSY
jgi:phosphoesterase RecJ-like protein